jgi:hypothetical protein
MAEMNFMHELDMWRLCPDCPFLPVYADVEGDILEP